MAEHCVPTVSMFSRLKYSDIWAAMFCQPDLDLNILGLVIIVDEVAHTKCTSFCM
jgi:hypothetical protein